MTWYALAKNQDYYAERVHRFIAMASCTHPIPYANLRNYDQIVRFFNKLISAGVYNQHGEDAASMNYYETLCWTHHNENCMIPDIDSWDLVRYYAVPIQTMIYYAQIFLEQRF